MLAPFALGTTQSCLLRLRLFAVAAAVLLYLLKLLLLRVGEQGFDLVAAVLHDAAYFHAAVVGHERRVGADALDLLLPVGDDGPDLVDLVLG